MFGEAGENFCDLGWSLAFPRMTSGIPARRAR